ncbi:hypothetical protein B9Z42_04380 [Limnohabitans sp. B9-3]|nr:hypothetical protein B9Z42_04380 [Limnohabitans sp. B9-3]
MKKENFLKSVVIYLAYCLAYVSFISSVHAVVENTMINKKFLGNDDDSFIFSGRCPNGQTYRLFSYQTQVNGITQFFYDYEGPVGKGTVKTRATAKTLAVRVCRPLAEIAND